MKILKLTHGVGDGVHTACLMTATNTLIGRPELLDSAGSCICHLLRAFIVPTNDSMPEPVLQRLYGPLPWEIVGTRTDDYAVHLARLKAFVHWTLWDILAPYAAHELGDQGLAERIRYLLPLVDQASMLQLEPPLLAAQTKYAPYAPGSPFEHVRSVLAILGRVSEVRWFMDAASVVRYCAHAAIAVAYSTPGEQIWEKFPEIIRKVAAIGEKREVRCVLTHQQLAEKLCPVGVA